MQKHANVVDSRLKFYVPGDNSQMATHVKIIESTWYSIVGYLFASQGTSEAQDDCQV